MKKKLIIGIIVLVAGLLLTINAFSQSMMQAPEMATVSTTVTNPKLFIPIISGVILALGFQLVLTSLSAASGITAIKHLDKRSNKEEGLHENERNKRNSTIANKYMSAAGIWTMLTGAISLFFASMLAVKLSLLHNNIVGFTLGLVIWALFTATMIYLESKAFGTIVGGLLGTAVKAIKAGFTGMSSVFGKSETEKVGAIADTIKREVSDFMEESDFGDKMNDAIEKVRPGFDAREFRKELAALLNEIKIEQQRGGITSRDKELYLKVAEKQPFFSKTDVTSLGNIFEAALAGIGLGGVSKKAGGLGKKASSYVQEKFIPQIKDKVEHYVLDNTSIYANPELVRAEIDEIFSHEISPENFLNNNGRIFNKNNVAQAVSEQKHVSKAEAMSVAEQVENALNNVLKESNIREIIREKTEDVKEEVKEQWGSKKEDLENRFENLFRRINRPELDYNVLKKEFQLILHNPSLAPKVMRMQLNQMDSDTVIGILTASGQLNKTEAKNILNRFEEMRQKAMNKLDQAEKMMEEKTEQAKVIALEQAEKVRKTAVMASWWMVLMLIVTGIAAGIGGIIGIG